MKLSLLARVARIYLFLVSIFYILNGVAPAASALLSSMYFTIVPGFIFDRSAAQWFGFVEPLASIMRILAVVFGILAIISIDRALHSARWLYYLYGLAVLGFVIVIFDFIVSERFKAFELDLSYFILVGIIQTAVFALAVYVYDRGIKNARQ